MRYKAVESFVVACVIDHKKSNVSIGSSNLFEPVWHPVDVNIGDVIVAPEYQETTKCLYLKQGKTMREIRHEPREFAPLEKQSSYNGLDTMLDCLEEL